MYTIKNYQDWILQCNVMLINEQRRMRIKTLAALALILAKHEKNVEEKRKHTKKRFRVRPRFQLRKDVRFYEVIFPALTRHEDKCHSYFRMSATKFEELLCIVGPSITKRHVIREPVPAAARLAMTLRYLATGDCITSTSFHYSIEVTTAINIIHETCKALWNCLYKDVLPHPFITNDWLQISNDFEDKWNFPHCIGAIDGKRVAIKSPNDADKDSHRIVLMAIVDANYRFTYVDIGAHGRRTDGGIFKDSLMGQKFQEKTMNLPEPRKLTVDGIPLPYVLVGDEAFQLSDFLLRPFPKKVGLNQERIIYNYRLNRARRVVENVFGILVSLWGVLKKPIEASAENAISIVQAIICLHNWIHQTDYDGEYIPIDFDDSISKAWRSELRNSAFENSSNAGNHNSTREAMNIREQFCSYFNEEGAVHWQYQLVDDEL